MKKEIFSNVINTNILGFILVLAIDSHCAKHKCIKGAFLYVVCWAQVGEIRPVEPVMRSFTGIVRVYNRANRVLLPTTTEPK